MSTGLSSEQEAFLEECLVEFSERFSDADLEYKKIYDLGIPQPPIMCPWSTRGRFNNRNDGRFNREERPYRRDERSYNRGGDGQYNNREGGRYSRDRRTYHDDQGNNSHNNRSDRSYHPYRANQESTKRPRPY